LFFIWKRLFIIRLKYKTERLIVMGFFGKCESRGADENVDFAFYFFMVYTEYLIIIYTEYLIIIQY